MNNNSYSTLRVLFWYYVIGAPISLIIVLSITMLLIGISAPSVEEAYAGCEIIWTGESRKKQTYFDGSIDVYEYYYICPPEHNRYGNEYYNEKRTGWKHLNEKEVYAGCNIILTGETRKKPKIGSLDGFINMEEYYYSCPSDHNMFGKEVLTKDNTSWKRIDEK